MRSRTVALSRTSARRRTLHLLLAGALTLGHLTGPMLGPVAAHDPEPADGVVAPAETTRPGGGPMLGSSPRVAAADDFSVPDFDEEIIWSGLTFPIAIEFAADGRVFVAEKSGLIKVFDGLDDPSPAIYADLRTNVHDFWDRGLLGMALDPAFVSNDRMYVAYTYNAAIGGVAPRWPDACPPPAQGGPGATVDGCVVSGRVSALIDGQDENVLVEDWCQQFPSHSMSDIVFDGAGALIVNGGDGADFNRADWGQLGGTVPNTSDPITPRNPCGDPPGGIGGVMPQATGEGGGLRSQDIRTSGPNDPLGLGGTTIRINRFTGNAMPDNPGPGSVTEHRKRVIAYGLRNPFRMAIHPVTGDLWIGDVGWFTAEEINRIPAGSGVRNFGWPCREGATFKPSGWDQTSLCTSLADSAITSPHFAYGRNVPVGGGCSASTGSVSGLAFYEGGPYPDTYDNALFFADYSRGCLWVMPSTGPGGTPNTAQVKHFADVAGPVHLTVGPGGDLFYVAFGGGQGQGSIRRIVYSFDNKPPTAEIEADPVAGDSPLVVQLDASGSSDPNDDPLSYAWDFGEGNGAFDDAFEVSPTHTYVDDGTYRARVRVSDGRGFSDVAAVTINVGNAAPTAHIDTPATNLRWSVGQTVSFSGRGTDAEQGILPASALAWQLTLRHCPAHDCHEHPIQTFNGATSGSFTAPDHEFPSHLALRLTVTDAHGATDTAEIALDPQTVTLQMRSSPSGMRLTAATTTGTTPFNVTLIRNSSVLLGVPSGQSYGGFPQAWAAWSNGGPRTQMVTASASATYTAAFVDGFDDVPPGTPFRADIGWLVTEGITAGCSSSPSLYCPNGLVTRGQMATFLSRALDLDPTTTDFFGDDESSIHERNINRLAASGITSGCGPGRFCPDGLVTRAQMATFLSRALDLPATSTDFFGDDESSIHERNINRLAASGITSGCGPGRFCPGGIVTRGQMAAFLHRGLAD